MTNPFATIRAISRRHLAVTAVRIFAITWAIQVYDVVGNHPALAWFYLPAVALCRVRVALFAIVFSFVLIFKEIEGPALRVAELGIVLQALCFILWARGQTLLALPAGGSHVAQRYRALLDAARPCAIAAAIVLAFGVCFRSNPVIECICWSVCIFSIALSIPSTRQATSLRRAFATFALTFFSVGLAALLLEGGARVLLPPAPVPSDIYMPDPRYIFTLRPNTQGDFVVRLDKGHTMSVGAKISSQGVRDRVVGPKKPGEFRIVMIGDSYTMGHGLRADQNIPHALETLLNTNAPPGNVTVINCGVGGYAPWQERGFLHARGFAFEPDLVILQVFPANDVAGTLTRAGKYLRVFDTGWENRVAMFRAQSEFPANVQRWLEKHVRVYTATAQALRAPNLASDVLGDLRGIVPVKLPRPAHMAERNPYREASLIDWYPELAEGYRLMDEDIRGIRDDCRARGVDFIAYCHPFPMGILDDSFIEFDRKTEGTLFERDKDVRITQELFQRAQIPYVNVTGALESRPDQASLYYIHDGHFTPHGAAIVAHALADYLQHVYFPKHAR